MFEPEQPVLELANGVEPLPRRHGPKPLQDVLTIGALATAACAYEGLREVFLVGFTANEVDTLSRIVTELLGSGSEEATAAALERVPAVRDMHMRARAGIAEDLPIGWAITWQAAGAVWEGAPPAATAADDGTSKEMDVS